MGSYHKLRPRRIACIIAGAVLIDSSHMDSVDS